MSNLKEIDLSAWTQVGEGGFGTVLDDFTAECKRFAALDVVLITYIHPVNWHQRLFLGLLAKSMFK